MTASVHSQGAAGSEASHPIPTSSDRIQLWQHFVNTAGEDKNRMISITSWLLGVSAGIIALMLTEKVDGEKEGVLVAFGIGVSVFAVYIVGLYWLHEKWNRTKANRVAESDPTLQEILGADTRPMGGRWVFVFFLGLALLSLIGNIIVAAM